MIARDPDTDTATVVSTPRDVLSQTASLLRVPACVIETRGTIVATNSAWDRVATETDTPIDAVGTGANYLDVCRRSAATGDTAALGTLQVLAAVVGGETLQGTLDYPCPSDTEIRWYRLTALPVDDGSFVLITHQDITAIVGADTASFTRGEEFVARAIHELAGPTTVLMGLLETLAAQGHRLGTDAVRDHLARAAQQARRQTRLIEGLRDVQSYGREAPRIRAVPVREALDAAVEAADDTGRVEREQVVAVLDDTAVRCDHDHLVRILTNLLTNAGKYGAPPVRVAATRVGRRVRLTVEDAGPGIPADVRPHLFESFARGRDHVRARLSGSGLGLTIVRDLVAVNGGAIRLDDGADGARFVIDLPAAAATRGP